MNSFVGKTIIDSDGNKFVIKKVKYTGLATGEGMSVIKKMSILTECGETFNTTESILKKALA